MSQELYKGIVDEWGLWVARGFETPFCNDLAQTWSNHNWGQGQWMIGLGPSNFRHQGLIPLPE